MANSDSIQLKRLWKPTLVISAPVAVVLVALWGFGVLGAGIAVAALAVAAIGTGFVVLLLLKDLSAVCEYAGSVAEDSGTRRPRLVFGDTLIQLLVVIRRLAGVHDRTDRARGNRPPPQGLDHLLDPVLILNARRSVIWDNAAAREMLGPGLVGRDLAAVIRNPRLLEAVDTVMEGEEETVEVEFSFSVPVVRHLRARVARVPDSEASGFAVAIALYDLTVQKRTEEMRSDFVANASHELRTPLSVILGSLQTLKSSAREDPKAQEEFLSLMEAQAHRMSLLVDDLLSLSHIELQEHTVPSGNVDIGNLVNQVISELAVKAEAQGREIDANIAENLPAVVGDLDDLFRALQNLVDNALKYGADETAVTIDARMATEDQLAQLSPALRYVALSVRDRGAGIAPEHLPRITERFYRVDTAQSRRLGGTGLGLAIVKHIVNRHRGTLLIDSVQNEGSVFTLILPAKA